MIGTIINFSSNEAAFLSQCIEEAAFFSSQIIVPVADHFFDGVEENLSLLNQIYSSFPQVQFIQYAWSEKNFYGKHPPIFWHDLSRLIGTYFLKQEIKKVLFIDADEIFEGSRFSRWIKNPTLEKYQAIYLACHWYFREARFRAKNIEVSPLFMDKSLLTYDLIMHPYERQGMFASIQGKKLFCALKENPLVHHYSWVRTKEELLRKVSSWGHRGERDWKSLIQEEFSRPFNGTDFVHGYEYEEIEPSLKKGGIFKKRGIPKNVIYLSTQDIHRLDLELKFSLSDNK